MEERNAKGEVRRRGRAAVALKAKFRASSSGGLAGSGRGDGDGALRGVPWRLKAATSPCEGEQDNSCFAAPAAE